MVASFTVLHLLILSPLASTSSSNLVFTCKRLHGSTCSCSTMPGNFCSASNTRVVLHLAIFSGCLNVFAFPLQWPQRTPNNIFHFVKLSSSTKSVKKYKREKQLQSVFISAVKRKAEFFLSRQVGHICGNSSWPFGRYFLLHLYRTSKAIGSQGSTLLPIKRQK